MVFNIIVLSSLLITMVMWINNYNLLSKTIFLLKSDLHEILNEVHKIKDSIALSKVDKIESELKRNMNRRRYPKRRMSPETKAKLAEKARARWEEKRKGMNIPSNVAILDEFMREQNQ